MNRTFKAAVAALMLAVGLAGSVAAGPFAYRKGDFGMALRLMRPLAEQGGGERGQNRGEKSGYGSRPDDASAGSGSAEAGTPTPAPR
jgi:hypothetical protein